ncbi:hypothetical protein EON65_20630 [archaeon]|nr:MAG: hypothetical protein EON65_20630 [archaeon]
MEQEGAALHLDAGLGGLSGEPQIKRPRVEDFGTTPEEILYKTSAHKDRAMANYYRRLSMNTEIKFFQEILDLEDVTEAMRRNVRSKLNTLIAKKMEDRYEDV